MITEILGCCATEQEVEQDCNDEIIVVKVVEYDVNARHHKTLLNASGDKSITSNQRLTNRPRYSKGSVDSSRATTSEKSVFVNQRTRAIQRQSHVRKRQSMLP
jgi:hypothetical protein